MAIIGFSTGALALGNFKQALSLMCGTSMTAVELSALRLAELPLLIDTLPLLDLGQFSYKSVHAPSRFAAADEDRVVELLRRVPREWPIVVHPDTIHDPGKWIDFGSRLALENLDRRKSDARNEEELGIWFGLFPNAKLCFDLAHTHQCDRTMTEGFRILQKFRDRICQLHISELDSTGHHFPLSFGSIQAFSEIASLIPQNSPVIVESLNPFGEAPEEAQRDWIEREAQRALEALGGTSTLFAVPIIPDRAIQASTALEV